MSPVIVQTLNHWRNDTDLAGIRDEAELAKLPADEQATWRSLWHDVDQVRERITDSAMPNGNAAFGE